MIRRLLPALPLFLLPCLLLWPAVFGGQSLVPADLLRDIAPWRTPGSPPPVPWTPLTWDSVAEFYPWRLFAAETLKSGYLPLWNPHQFCGTPFVANSQSAVFYPPNLLFCLLPVWRAFGVSALLHLIVTGLFAYAFLRVGALRLGRAASLLGAVCWQLCHWQVAWLALPTFLCVSAWLPLALLLVDRTVLKLTPVRACLLGLCLGLMLLAGHLQIALYCLGFTSAYALFRVTPLLKAHWRLYLGCAVLALVLAFGLAAPQLLPAVELARMSHRAGGTVTWEAYQGYVRLALPPANLITLFAPGFYGNPTRGTYWGIDLNGGPGAYIENACYVGVLPLLLALTGLTLTWRRSLTTRFFAVAAFVALLLALGTPIDALLFFGIPGFAQTGSPGRILVLWSFCLPVLAAIGTDALLQGERIQTLGRAAAAFAVLALLAFGYAALWIGGHAPAGTLTANLGAEADLWRLPVGILLGTAAVFWLRERGSLGASAVGGSLIVLAAVDLLAAGYGFNRTSAPKDVYPVTPLIAFLQQHAGEGRVMPVNRRWSHTNQPPPSVLPPNTGMVYGLSDTQGYDSLLTGQYFQFAGRMDGGSPAPLENGNMVFTYGIGSPEAREAGARYVVTQTPLPGEPPVFQADGAFVYEDKEAQPRIRLQGGKVEDDGAPYLVMDKGPDQVSILMNDGFTAPASMTVADQWYPGWHGYFGGRQVSLARGPGIFRTLTLTARQQASSAQNNPLEMRYEPEAFRIGLFALCLSLGAVAGLGTAALCGRLRGRSGRREGGAGGG